MRILAFTLCFFFIVSIPSAYALTQVSVYVDSSGRAQILGVSDEQPTLPAGVSLNEGRIEGYTESITSKDGGVWHLSYAIESSEALIVLPEGTTVQSLSAGEITTNRGKIAIYVQNVSDIYYVVQPLSASTSTFGTLLGLIAVMVIGLAYWYSRRITKKTSSSHKKRRIATANKLEIVSSVLNVREREIIEVVQRVGKQKMSAIRALTTIPKASFSRHIHELVKKKLIRLTGEGKNKFVELVKN